MVLNSAPKKNTRRRASIIPQTQASSKRQSLSKTVIGTCLKPPLSQHAHQSLGLSDSRNHVVRINGATNLQLAGMMSTSWIIRKRQKAKAKTIPRTMLFQYSSICAPPTFGFNCTWGRHVQAKMQQILYESTGDFRSICCAWKWPPLALSGSSHSGFTSGSNC